MGILDNAKDIAKAVEGIHNLELYQRVLALYSDIVGMVEENIKLREENRELKNSLALKATMVFKAPFYFASDDPIPYCPRCWETKQTAIHLFKYLDRSDLTRWDCHDCNKSYRIEKQGSGY